MLICYSSKLNSSYLYVIDFARSFDKKFIEALESRYYEFLHKNDTNISVLHLDVVEHIKVLGLRYKIEERLMGLDVDVIFYDEEWKNTTAVLEIHGYHHFLRNFEILTGATAFKESIIRKYVKHYFFIDIQNWEILPNNKKREFLEKLLAPLSE